MKSRVTKQEILTVENTGNFDLIKDKIWEDKVFENVEIVVGNPLSESMSECMMVIVEPGDPDMNRSIQRIYRDRYPEMAEMCDKFETIENTIKIKNKNIKGVKEITRRIIKIKATGMQGDLWNLLKRVKEYINEENVSNLVTHKITEVKAEELKKKDVEHAIFYCHRWTREREKCEVELGMRGNVDNMVEKILESEEGWKVIERMLVTVMKAKCEYEREREKGDRK